jgi:3-oxoacyl-[acyl-carrier-protein] synthase-3
VTRYATIAGVGSSLPPRLVPNAWFESFVETNDEWIRDRTGIEARHFAEPDVQTSDLALEASRAALAAAGISAEQLDMIVVATITGDTVFPATSVWLQRKLGVSCPAFDVNAACSGFSYGLSAANAFITSGMADTILLVGAEIFSRIIDYTDRGTVVLFGDGAGAAVVRASEAPGFEGAVLGADGNAAEILWMPAGGTRTPPSYETVDAHDHTVRMPNGREVFKRAVTEMAAASRELLEKSGLGVDDIDVLIPHQANARIMNAVVERLGVDPGRAVVDVAEVGNTSAASIPIALDRAWRSGRIRTGDRVLFASFGAGLTWGATLLTWTMPEPSGVSG